MSKSWEKILHLGDPAFTATVLADEARRRGYDWKVLQWATTEQHSSHLATLAHKALRGAKWEANFARHRIRYPLIHLHSALALSHVSWALRTYALHLHGTDIRTQQYKQEFRDRVLKAINGAAVVFYSTPDIREHTLLHRADPILAPVPVAASSTPIGHAPRILSGVDYVFFTSRWEEVKGGQRQIDFAHALRSHLSNSIQLVGLDWGPNAEQAADAGVKLISKQTYPDFLATIAGARLAVGQHSGVLGASELDALDLNVPLASPLRPQWYDGSSPSLVDPPVIGANLPIDDIDGLATAVAAALDADAPQTHDWVQEHHSPRITLDVVLSGYDRYFPRKDFHE